MSRTSGNAICTAICGRGKGISSDGAAVAAAAGAFCVVEVLLPIFFDRLRTFAAFLRWMSGLTTIVSLRLSVMVCSYGVEVLRGSLGKEKQKLVVFFFRGDSSQSRLGIDISR
jgi:hypothetical protein